MKPTSKPKDSPALGVASVRLARRAILFCIWPIMIAECTARELRRCWKNANFKREINEGQRQWKLYYHQTVGPNVGGLPRRDSDVGSSA